MCRYCVEFGGGTKWYLNPENYRQELYTAPGHVHGFSMIAGAGRNTYETGSVAQLEDRTLDYFHGDGVEAVVKERVMQHAGQVIPLEDALKVVDGLPWNRFLLTVCYCRKYFGRGDFYSCLFFEPVIEKALAERPWETDNKVIDKEEAKQFLIEMDKKGMCHAIYDVGVDADGRPPVVICNCHTAECLVGAAMFLGRGHRKGEYVAKVDTEKCRQGCKSYPVCLKMCQFGAIRYSPLENVASIALERCYGCGVCRQVCPTGALELVDRLTYPALVDVW